MTQQPQVSVITEEMRKVIGVWSEPYVNEVEKGAILRFAEAVEDFSPSYTGGRRSGGVVSLPEDPKEVERFKGEIIAPPTFFRSMKAGPSKATYQSPLKRGLDGGSEWDFFEHVKAGDKITVTSAIVGFNERQTRLGVMLFTTRETRYVNQYGRLVAIQRSTGMSY